MILPSLATLLLDLGIWSALVCAGIGLVFAYFLIRKVIAYSPGNEQMKADTKLIRHIGAAGLLE